MWEQLVNEPLRCFVVIGLFVKLARSLHKTVERNSICSLIFYTFIQMTQYASTNWLDLGSEDVCCHYFKRGISRGQLLGTSHYSQWLNLKKYDTLYDILGFPLISRDLFSDQRCHFMPLSTGHLVWLMYCTFKLASDQISRTCRIIKLTVYQFLNSEKRLITSQIEYKWNL